VPASPPRGRRGCALLGPRSGSLTYVGGTKQKPVWIALSGTASIIRDDDVKREMWIDDLERWFENGPEDPAVVLIKVNARRASWWSYDDEGEVELG
jgi:general stress protein 26